MFIAKSFRHLQRFRSRIVFFSTGDDKKKPFTNRNDETQGSLSSYMNTRSSEGKGGIWSSMLQEKAAKRESINSSIPQTSETKRTAQSTLRKPLTSKMSSEDGDDDDDGDLDMSKALGERPMKAGRSRRGEEVNEKDLEYEAKRMSREAMLEDNRPLPEEVKALFDDAEYFRNHGPHSFENDVDSFDRYLGNIFVESMKSSDGTYSEIMTKTQNGLNRHKTRIPHPRNTKKLLKSLQPDIYSVPRHSYGFELGKEAWKTLADNPWHDSRTKSLMSNHIAIKANYLSEDDNMVDDPFADITQFTPVDENEKMVKKEQESKLRLDDAFEKAFAQQLEELDRESKAEYPEFVKDNEHIMLDNRLKHRYRSLISELDGTYGSQLAQLQERLDEVNKRIAQNNPEDFIVISEEERQKNPELYKNARTFPKGVLEDEEEYKDKQTDEMYASPVLDEKVIKEVIRDPRVKKLLSWKPRRRNRTKEGEMEPFPDPGKPIESLTKEELNKFIDDLDVDENDMDYESEDLENLMEYDTEVEKDFVADERELPSRYVSWQEVENEMTFDSKFRAGLDYQQEQEAIKLERESAESLEENRLNNLEIGETELQKKAKIKEGLDTVVDEDDLFE